MLSLKQKAKFGAKCELARRSFWYYCKTKAPNFYKEDRTYLVTLCNEFQSFYESDDEVMIINLPPRHGKSRTAGLFVEWVLGDDQNQKVMTGSYNETLSTTFSKNVRNDIQEAKADENKIVFSDIFPGISIKKGDGAMNLWSLKDGYNNYLATSPTGTATGFGASLMLIDDLIKNAEEANNETVKEKHWDWFANTMLSRLEEGGKIIIIMTRWASDDLAGKALEHFRNEGAKVRHVSMKALLDPDTHEMLCPAVLSYKSYMRKVKAMGADIASANYQQEPIDLKGRLYSNFKTYTKLPMDEKGNSLLEGIYSYTDTADEGNDYLCTIIWGAYRKEAYVLDVYYTQAGMEETEPEVARRFFEHQVALARIESNNGGSGFARNVIRLLMENHQSNYTDVRWFHQNKNKLARILSNATWIMNHVHFPVNWRDLWPEYYDSMIKFQRSGENKHDDAQDATTGVAETMTILGA
ncbi:MAG: phage terminase large subunit [Lachnospiraceae bacterium]|nr:phage terminase large subunit [Lachnospiraceae bacterium]